MRWGALILTILAAGCTQGTRHPVSDVPCLEEPTAWPKDGGDFYVRNQGEQGKDLLLVHYSSDQFHVDWTDDIYGNAPHGAVYRFNSTSQSFQQVDDPAWDESTEPVVFCDVQDRRDVAFGVGPGYLTFEGREIPIAGRTIIDVWGALNSPVVAVLSTDGSYVNVPAFTAPTVSGQYYHQLFSEVDGSPIGEPVRIGVGGRSPDLSVCWSAEETQVIYSEFSSQLPGGYLSICVVDVGDEMAAFRGE